MYDPLKDLQLLGRLFHAKSKASKSKNKSKVKIRNTNTNTNKGQNNTGIKPEQSSLNELTRAILSPHAQKAEESFDRDPDFPSFVLPNLSSPVRNPPLSSPSHNNRGSPSPSPTPIANANSNVIPSFVNRDVRAFARLVHHSSSFISNRTSLGTHIESESQSDTSGFIEDTLPITQSQSQSQSQSQLQRQDINLSETHPDSESDVPDFTNYHDTTFESHADTSTVALPEAMLRDGSGILGMSDDDDDEGEEVDVDVDGYDEEDIYRHNLSIIAGSDTSDSSEYEQDIDQVDINDPGDIADIGIEDISSHNVPVNVGDDSFSDLSLIRIHDENVTRRKHQRQQSLSLIHI